MQNLQPESGPLWVHVFCTILDRVFPFFTWGTLSFKRFQICTWEEEWWWRKRWSGSLLCVHKMSRQRQKLFILMPNVSPPLHSQDYQRGIFQSIGFKEFHDYLTAPEGSSPQEKDKLRLKGQRNSCRLLWLDPWTNYLINLFVSTVSASRLLLFHFINLSRHRRFKDRNKALRPPTE